MVPAHTTTKKVGLVIRGNIDDRIAPVHADRYLKVTQVVTEMTV